MLARLIERLGWAGIINPQALTTAVTGATSGAVDMSKVGRLLAQLAIGVNSGTVGMSLRHSPSTQSSDSSAFDTALAITGLTAGSIQRQIELNAEDMPAASRYVFAVLTGSHGTTNTSLVSVNLLTADPHLSQPDAAGDNLAGVSSIASADLLR
jgi:hypothetical protein